MSQSKTVFQALPGTTLRRLRNTPSYFFLIWRWSMWLYALIVVIGSFHTPFYTPLRLQIGIILLVVTFLQSLIVTVSPLMHIFSPRISQLLRPSQSARQFRRKRPRPLAEDEEADILTPLSQTRNIYWDATIYTTDLLICGLALYFGGALGDPPFGAGSIFHRYSLSTVFAAALAYRYRGGLAAAFGFELFVLLGIFLPPPGAEQHVANIIDIAGSLIDAPLVAILSAYVATLLSQYAQSKRREQDNVRRQQAFIRVSELLMHNTSDIQQLLQQSVAQIRQGGHFQRLVIASVVSNNEHNASAEMQFSCVEDEISGEVPSKRDEALFQSVARSRRLLSTFEPLRSSRGYGLARLYVPLLKEEQVHLIMGAESVRQTPFTERQEKFLTITGTQLLVALDNIRLTEQTIELAAAAERGRIAREIHDGVAQLIYMLSLNAETCSTQAHRIAEASEEDAELLLPLAQRLDKLVTLSKQALWETRNYMFNLKPLISGTTTLPQMLTNQLKEFEAISGIRTRLHIAATPEGERAATGQASSRQPEQVGTTIFRIVQEALTNAYKHAGATEILVYVRQGKENIEVEICDNGHGLAASNGRSDDTAERIYSGRGLSGMRERAAELGGTVEVTQLPENGVRVYACIPAA
jgi:signal transduction histidine kinase